MKYSSLTHTIFFATIATLKIQTGSAVPRPGPASKTLPAYHQPRTRNSSDSKSSFGLQVDREGNLYSPRTIKQQTKHSQAALSIRGGEICVDNEGNFYTPSACHEILQAKTAKEKAPSQKPLSSFALRGGSYGNHLFGGLAVDTEGNLFAVPDQAASSATPAKPATAALSLRGGSLSVDNEGNFYTPRRLEKVGKVIDGGLPSNRRLKSHSTDEVLLTKSGVTKKISHGHDHHYGHGQSHKTKKALLDEIIRFNNQLMET